MSVVDLVQATLNNTSLILNIFCQLMALPLAYQLTCIAGNLLVRIIFFTKKINFSDEIESNINGWPIGKK
jgi:hypothetical protein